MQSSGDSIKTTVLIMTYNHERFIAQAVDSVLAQQTTCAFEIVISEDCSTDATRTIVQQYAGKYPDRIRLILSGQNLRSNEIVTRGIRAARGEYIALLDGDDYWLRSDKLQKQADFLDLHPECSVCFHQAVVRHDGDDREGWHWTPKNQQTFSTLEHIWMGNFIATSSTMFRRSALGEVPDWYTNLFFPITDWPLHVLNAERGNLAYIDEVLSVYRYHSGGAYSGLSEARKQDETYRLYGLFNRVFEYRYDRFIKAGIFTYFIDWAIEYVRRGDRDRAKVCLRRALTGRPRNSVAEFRKFIRIWCQVYISR